MWTTSDQVADRSGVVARYHRASRARPSDAIAPARLRARVSVGIDLAGIGPHGASMAEEIRKLTLARLAGEAKRLLDPDDLVQAVYRRILRRNHRPKSAFDPTRASVSQYVHQIAGNAIVDELAKVKRIEQRELHGDPDREEDAYEVNADPRDPIAALEELPRRHEVTWSAGAPATRHSVTRNALRRVIAVFGAPPFAVGHARNEKRSATPVPLHFHVMPETGACGKPRVMPHSHRP
jgi:hypothetical protein